jgi:hypothetical protein
VTVSGGEGRVSVRPGDFAETRWQLGGPRNQVTLRYMVAKFRGERGRRLLCFEDIVKKFYRAITSNDCRRGACRPWRQGGIAEMPLGFSAWFRRTRREWKKPGWTLTMRHTERRQASFQHELWTHSVLRDVQSERSSSCACLLGRAADSW